MFTWNGGPGWADYTQQDSTEVRGTVRREAAYVGGKVASFGRWAATVDGEQAKARFGSRREAQKFVEGRVA